MLRFTSITLKNWRNFKQIEVDLQGRAFLVGPNASGKSNFLDAFRFLRDIVGIGGGFQQAIRQRGGVSTIRCMSARESTDITIKVLLGDDDNPQQWTYELVFNQDSQRRPVVKVERVAQHGDRGTKTILERPDANDKTDSERLTQTHIEQILANQRFREVAEVFGAVRYFHIVPQLVREPDRSMNRFDDPYGGDFLAQIYKKQKGTQQARLRKITQTLQAAVPQLEELKVETDERGLPHLRGRYKHWRPGGQWLDEDQFSDGTLRLIGLLWSLLDGEGALLLEEPELSLNPNVVRFIPQFFAKIQLDRDRQILVSTHSNDLLMDEGIALDEALVFAPGKEGTQVRTAAAIPEIVQLVNSDISLADAVFPHTRPDHVEQLSMFEP